MDVFIDIETVPAQDPRVREEIRAVIKPPGTFKKPESIAAWIAENGDAEADRKWRDTALDGTQGEVLCIGLAIDDDPPVVFSRRLDMPEAGVLKEAFAFLLTVDDDDLRSLTWIGHNAPWDLRFLFQRCCINDVRPTVPLRFEAKPNSGFVIDTMQMWAGFGQRISLDRLCRALNIPTPKTDEVNGATVYDLALAGRYDDIARYCARDVEAVRQIHRRLELVRG